MSQFRTAFVLALAAASASALVAPKSSATRATNATVANTTAKATKNVTSLISKSVVPTTDFALGFNKAFLSLGKGHALSKGKATMEAEFEPKCLEFSKSLVYKEQGRKERVGKQMHIVCATVNYAPDVRVCEAYAESLYGHLHGCGRTTACDGDDDWNVNGMDYPLFCKGMYKVLASFGLVPPPPPDAVPAAAAPAPAGLGGPPAPAPLAFL